jgi:hypothetical protein
VAIRPESRWWVAILVLLALLFGLSALALDRPNVVWRSNQPQCPHCRSTVPMEAHRCPACREEFDWAVAPDEDSPLSQFTLSEHEVKRAQARVKELGVDAAAAQVAAAWGTTVEAAREVLEDLKVGRCGWCGGTGKELPPASGAAPTKAPDCTVCRGEKACIGCGGDRRVRLGDAEAERALARYREAVNDLPAFLSAEERRLELERLGDEFLDRHAGTVQATAIISTTPGHGDRPALDQARERWHLLLRALGI